MLGVDDRRQDIIDTKIKLAKAHYDKSSSRISNLLQTMTADDNDEDGKFGIIMKNRRKVRKVLNTDWDNSKPNLMLNLPTKIT